MTSSELKDLLQAMAADGSESVDLAERELVPRIQRRRRRRATLSVASGVAAAVAIGAIAYGVQPSGGEPPAAGPSPTLQTMPTLGVPTCGQPPIRRSETDSPLRLTMTQPSLTRGTNRWSASVSTTLTNTTSKPMTLRAALNTSLYLVQDGKVVSRPLGSRGQLVDLVLQPGKSHTFVSAVSVQRCDPAAVGGADPLTEPPLPTGSYELHGAHSISQHAGIWDDLPGGPWPVTLD